MKDNGYFGVMINLSSAVMKVEELKKFAFLIKKLGYNMIQLYTEDTYEVDGEDYFGYLRGAYTKNELKDIVSYCNSIGIEVIPCVELLAHLSTIFKWNDYAQINDTDDILLIDEQRTYTLIENIFKTLRECFTSDRVNIGVDEAHNLGRGKYLSKHGYADKSKLFFKHVNAVTKIAEEYGFRPMIWSDMLFKNIYGSYYDAKPDGKISTVKENLPNNLDLVYWEYFFYDADKYEYMLKLHKEFDNPVWFAGTVHNYIGSATNNQMANASLLPAIQACKKQGIDNVLITLWGGGECSHFLTLPSLCYVRCVYEGITDESQISKRFFDAVGEDYHLMLSLDAPNTLAGSYLTLPEVDFCRFTLYQDIFSGYFDPVLTEGACNAYFNKSTELEKQKANSAYEYLFDVEIALLRSMYLKHDLGILLRRAYQSKNTKELTFLHERIHKTISAVSEFYKAIKTMWKTENKLNGLEIMDVKLGGLISRLNTCAEILKDYLDGKITEIPELNSTLKPFNAVGTNYLFWSKIVTVNRFD